MRFPARVRVLDWHHGAQAPEREREENMRREPIRFDYWRVEKPGAALSFALFGQYVRDYRAQVWRYRVRLDHGGGRVVGSAGGGGYDKQSHALAIAIERVAGIPVAHVGGAGVAAVAAAVAAAGWRLVDSDALSRRGVS